MSHHGDLRAGQAPHQPTTRQPTLDLHRLGSGLFHKSQGIRHAIAFIHVKVYAPGYAPLTTQLYFKGDPYNAIDPFININTPLDLVKAERHL